MVIDDIDLNTLKTFKIKDDTKVTDNKENLFERLDYEEVRKNFYKEEE